MNFYKLLTIQNDSISGERVTLLKAKLGILNDKTVKRLYMKRIPKQDRLSIDELKTKFHGKRAHFYTVHNEESPSKISGIILASEFPSYIYLDYLATDESTKGTRLGKRALTAFCNHFSIRKPIVVKIGDLGTDYYHPRVNFYRDHCGFSFICNATLVYDPNPDSIDKSALLQALRSESLN